MYRKGNSSLERFFQRMRYATLPTNGRAVIGSTGTPQRWSFFLLLLAGCTMIWIGILGLPVFQPAPAAGRWCPPASCAMDTVPPLLLEKPSELSIAAWNLADDAKLDPLNGKHGGIDIDDQLTVEALDLPVPAGKTHSVTFKCSHVNATLHCPWGYNVWFVGPTLHAPPFASSKVLDERRVRVTFTLDDPGMYKMYAYPEHKDCGVFEGTPKLYNTFAVRGSPFQIKVAGKSPSEGSIPCPSSSLPFGSKGRWISKAHINPAHMTSMSPFNWWLPDQLAPTSSEVGATRYSYIWAPYSCKVPHHPFKTWLDTTKIDSLLFLGDSVLRDYFCLILYAGVKNEGEKTSDACIFSNDESYHLTDKNITYVRADGGVTQLTFIWLPQGSPTGMEAYFKRLTPSTIPSHIIVGWSLWFARMPANEYTKSIKTSLDKLLELAPDAKILARTSGAVVQAIQCYDRIGGQRWEMEKNNAALILLLSKYPSVSLMDVYPVFNSHPAATPDGRHWGAIGHTWDPRPEVGIAEFAASDAAFHSWSAATP